MLPSVLLTSAIQVLPLAAARYRTFTGHYTPPGFTIFADALFLSSGLLNVLLYAYTRPFLFPHTGDDGSVRTRKSTDSVYDAPEIAHHPPETLPMTRLAGDRDIPGVNISDEV